MDINGTLISSGVHNKDVKVGQWSEWYVNNNIKSSVMFDDNGVKNGCLYKW